MSDKIFKKSSSFKKNVFKKNNVIMFSVQEVYLTVWTAENENILKFFFLKIKSQYVRINFGC